MALHVKLLTFQNWRNFQTKTVSFDERLTILSGKNASGKTNTIEALQLLTSKKSFRNPKIEELLNNKNKKGCIQGTVVGDKREIDLLFYIDGNKRALLRNNKKTKVEEITQDIFPVLFIPDDLLLIKQSASYRRDEIDSFGSLSHIGYKKLFNRYEKTLRERNAYLKGNIINNEELEVLDLEVSMYGAKLLEHRISLFNKLKNYTQKIYQEIVSRETLMLLYEPSWTNQKIDNLTVQEIQDTVLRKLKDNREKDALLKQTTVGPHRDNYVFYINNKDARTYASQGQQRSAVLAWKMAQIRFIQDILQKTPLLLLDDVMSELDEKRREAVVSYIQQGVQTIITTTHLEYFQPGFLKEAKVVQYE